MPSIFTQIINREIPATIEYEDEEFIVFRDIHPAAPVHVLVVPKHDYHTLEAVDQGDVSFHARLLQTARKVAKMLGIEENYKLVMNVGEQMQAVPHLHLHVLGGWSQKEREEVKLKTI